MRCAATAVLMHFSHLLLGRVGISHLLFDGFDGFIISHKFLDGLIIDREFTQIFQLCDFILENSQDPALLTITLQTLVRFLFWIPVGYIFETKLIETLAVKFFPVALFQNDTLQCLTEIGSLQLKDRPQYSQKFVSLFVAVVSQVDKLLTSDTDIPAEYAKGNPAVTDFVRHLTLFLTGFLKAHLDLLETPDENVRRNLYVALNILLRISQVDDVVIFKICLEYWSTLVVDLYNAQKTQVPRQPLMVGNLHKQNMCQRVLMYAEVLSRLRHVMIAKMAKPEEVLIVEDEYGQIIREPMKDTDSIVLYKNMREALIYLTHLDPIDTQDTMLMKLARQVDGQEWSWHNLNTLCWAIGSISGALSEMQEKTFLVRVIKDLLGLCEMKKGKDHKAVIASNIMYVVGQYPRFLRQHWKFLKTVVNKLFEFMHETHPGVQDMSCDTFLKITTKCRRKFVQVQLQETRPFIEDILENLPETIHDLEQSQIHTFYEAVGQIISSQNDPEKRQFLVFKLMELPNQSWSTIINQANHSTDALWNPATVKQVVLVLKTNDHVASSLGSGYIVQLGRIYLEMLQVYKMYSQYVSQKIQEEGPSATKTSLIRSMRAVKKETLNLIQSFVENCQEGDKEAVYKNFLPALMDPVLDDYKRNVPDARDAEVLSLFAAIVAKLGERMVDHVSRIFESVFQCTLDMITKNFEDFPDHRVSFFNLLHEITKYSFPALLRLNSAQFQLVIDSIVWGIKHLDRNISDLGLSILLELVTKVETTEVANDFFKSYFVSLTNDCLSVLADSFHKAGFRLQSAILAKLFSIIESGAITVPLWKAGQGNFANNQTFVRDFVVNLLSTSFPNVARAQNEQFVMGLFTYHSNLAEFKTHLRDFLIQLKEFSATGEDNKELYMEEQDRLKQQQQEEEKQRVMAVPGLLYTGPSAGMSAPVQDDDEDL